MARGRNRPSAPDLRLQRLTASRRLLPDEVKRFYAPPERLAVWEWAQKHRYLSRKQTSPDRTGFWRNERAPYLVPLMALLVRRGIEMVTILKASQVGASEAVRNVIAYWAEREPDPLLLVLPDKDKGKSIIRNRILPMFAETRVLADLATGRRWDSKNSELTLANGFVLRLGYSGSISSVASDPARRVICDERSKFQADGKVSIAESIEARTTTYEDSRVVNLSTPGADPDPTADLFELADIKLFYFCPCPHCGAPQVWCHDLLEWEPKKAQQPDKVKRAAEMVHQGAAWMHCSNPACAVDHPDGQGRVYDRHKARAVAAGYFSTLDGSWKIFPDGHEEGSKPPGAHVAMKMPAFISLAPKHRFTAIARKFILAEGSPEALRGYYNELLAEVFQEPTSPPPVASQFAKRCLPDPETGFSPAPQAVLPLWVSRVLMTVDTQKDHFYYVIRGWGYGYRSRRLRHGRALSFDELRELFYRSSFEYENGVYPPLGCYMLGIDSGGGIRRTNEFGVDGSRTDDVYQFCLTDPEWLKPMKGEGRRPQEMPQRLRRIEREPAGGKLAAYTVWLNFFDAVHYEDLLASYIGQRLPMVNPQTGELIPDREEDFWQLNDFNDEDYNRHLSNVLRKLITSSRGDKFFAYRPKVMGARVDYRDCEIEQIALAHGAGMVRLAPRPADLAAMRLNQSQPSTAGGVQMPDGRNFLATRR